MGAVWHLVRAEGRRRWASWLALSVLVALVGGTVLAGAAAARRTDAALPDFLARYGYDAAFFSTSPSSTGTVASWPYVTRVVSTPLYQTPDLNVHGQLLTSATVIAATEGVEHEVVKLASGGWPVRTDEVDVGYAMAQQFHLREGSTFALPLYAASQRSALQAQGALPARGPRVPVVVAGIVVSVFDFPSGLNNDTIVVSPSFEKTVGPRALAGVLGFVRLKGGAVDLPRFTYQVNHLPVPGGAAGSESDDAAVSSVQGSIHPQVVGWWLFALLTGLAGLALIGQGLSRQSVVVRDAYPVLSALGTRPGQLFSLGIARSGAIGVGGAAGALALVTALSPLTPVGEARIADPTTGVAVDPLVFCLGGFAVVAVTLLLGCRPAWRDAQTRHLRRTEARLTKAGASRLAAAAARAGAPPTAVIGMRHALERGRGRTSVPVATALVGTILAVGALVATSVFGSSLSELVSTPRLYGQDFQAVLGGLPTSAMQAVVSRLTSDPAVEAVSYAQLGKYLTVNDVSVDSTLVVAAKGPLALSIASGRDPNGPGEVMLGTQTLRAAHASVGSTVVVSVISPRGGGVVRGRFRVVGTTVFPPALSPSGTGLGVGVVVPLGSAIGFLCGGGEGSSACRSRLHDQLYEPTDTGWGIAIRVAPTSSGRAALHQLDNPQLASYVTPLAVPTNLVNFGEAVDFPLLLGIALALFGAATLAHLLLTSAARRRREFALLKVLGFRRRQLRATIAWQATTVAAIGIAVGVPVGVVAGNIIWQAFASDLGVVPLTVISALAVSGIAMGVFVVAGVMSVIPASIAARTNVADALHRE